MVSAQAFLYEYLEMLTPVAHPCHRLRSFEHYFDTIQGRRYWVKPLPCSKEFHQSRWSGTFELAKMRVAPLLLEFLVNILGRIQGFRSSFISAISSVLLDKPFHWSGIIYNGKPNIMAWCNETSEIHKKINKYQNSTNNMDNLNNYKRDENLVL
ncbi:hypothetical protein U3516DRAFT_785822 [Neocallimastix sp. 'constans']